MKKLIVITAFLFVTALVANAQVKTNIRPEASGKMGEYGEWQKVDVSFGDGSEATVEYRVRLAARKGIGCHYDLEVKNTSSEKLNVRGMSSYYDQLVKSNFGDAAKESVKPGKSVEMRFIAQGCKKEKGSDKDDFGHCMACEFGIDLFVAKP
ncbi:MAG TPA: hypothetical protein VFE50_11905 [Cyclobacteriaceae bacterium]|nr:hypothetical protein [Cyclobacteriaceae bacterium]